MKNIYEITFDTKLNKREYPWLIHVEDTTANLAKKQACEKWLSIHNNHHMFHVKVRRVKPGEVINYAHWFIPDDRREWGKM